MRNLPQRHSTKEVMVRNEYSGFLTVCMFVYNCIALWGQELDKPSLSLRSFTITTTLLYNKNYCKVCFFIYLSKTHLVTLQQSLQRNNIRSKL